MYKKRISVLLITVALLRISIVAWATSDPIGKEEYNGYPLYDIGFVLCEDLTIRESAYSYAKAIATIGYGEYCDVMHEEGNWCYISYFDIQNTHVEGWVRSEYVLVNPAYFTPVTETPVYAYPSKAAKRVGLIDNELIYPIIEEYGNYYVISLRGASGFVEK